MEDRMQSAIDALERAIQERRVQLTTMEQSLAQLRGSAPDYATTPKTTEWVGLGLTEAAFRWLVEMGEPRGTREIADGIRDRGVQTGSNNFTATVYATLKNAKGKFVRTPEGLWDVKERGKTLKAVKK